MKYQKYPAQTIKVAGDLRRAPATFENPACPATAIYEALSHFLYFDTCIKIIVVGNCIKGKVSYKEFYWIFWTLEF